MLAASSSFSVLYVQYKLYCIHTQQEFLFVLTNITDIGLVWQTIMPWGCVHMTTTNILHICSTSQEATNPELKQTPERHGGVP